MPSDGPGFRPLNAVDLKQTALDPNQCLHLISPYRVHEHTENQIGFMISRITQGTTPYDIRQTKVALHTLCPDKPPELEDVALVLMNRHAAIDPYFLTTNAKTPMPAWCQHTLFDTHYSHQLLHTRKLKQVKQNSMTLGERSCGGFVEKYKFQTHDLVRKSFPYADRAHDAAAKSGLAFANQVLEQFAPLKAPQPEIKNPRLKTLPAQLSRVAATIVSLGIFHHKL